MNWNKDFFEFMNFQISSNKSSKNKIFLKPIKFIYQNISKFNWKIVKILIYKIKKNLIKLFYLKILQKNKKVKILNTINLLLSKKHIILYT